MPFCLSTANNSIPAALQPVLNNTFSPNPPSGMASKVVVRYRLPGRDKKATTIDYIEPPQNRPSGGGNGNGSGSGNGTLNGTNGKTGYAPPSGGGGSRSVTSDALKVLDFLQIDEKLLSYSDLQAEADDLYAKHGFRTYVVPRYPIFYDLSDLGEAEYHKDALARIHALNTDGKPYIVIDLKLKGDLDFQEEIMYFKRSDWDKNNDFTDVQWELFNKFIVAEFAAIGNKNLDATELTKATEYVTNSLSAREKYKEYNPKQYFRDGNIGSGSNKTNIKAVRSEEVFNKWNNSKNTILKSADEVKKALKPVLQVLDQNKTNALLSGNPNQIVTILNKWSLVTLFADIDNLDQNTIYSRLISHFESINKYFEEKYDVADINNIPQSLQTSLGIVSLNNSLRNQWNIFKKQPYIEEVTSEWYRFDDEMTGTEVTNILTQLNNEVKTFSKDNNFDFHAGELKAYLARETADFTDKKIAGLDTKVKGITQNQSLNKLYFGLPQVDIQGKATKNALSWVNPGITFSQSDASNSKKAFQLAAAYMGFVAKELGAEEYFEKNEKDIYIEQNGQSMHPLYPAKGIDMKLLIMAGYNVGAGNVRKQVLAKLNPQIDKSTDFNNLYNWDYSIENLFKISSKSEVKQAPYTICGVKWRMGEDFNNCKAHE
jgi:hypothetical protein